MDANKYHGGSYDGFAMGTSAGESFIPVDYGDLPDVYNMTIKSDDGAQHTIIDLYLGSAVDADADGQGAVMPEEPVVTAMTVTAQTMRMVWL